MPDPDGRRRILILGGTAEARRLADAVDFRHGDAVDLITALAGRLERRPILAGRMRVGGFGGSEGLASYLDSERIDLLIDATHPFASVMSHHAEAAAARAGVPRLMLVRPAWRTVPGDDWRDVGDLAAAAALLPSLGSNAFLTTGIGGLAAFAAVPGAWYLVRLMEPAKATLPLPRYETVIGKPPFDREAERRLMTDHRIAAVVTKNSGGAATEAKLTAARDLGLPVIMVQRPVPPPGERVESVDTALDWLTRRL